jgi:hypothetical protein
MRRCWKSTSAPQISEALWSAAACWRFSRSAGPACWRAVVAPTFRSAPIVLTPRGGVSATRREQARTRKAAASCRTPKRFAQVAQTCRFLACLRFPEGAVATCHPPQDSYRKAGGAPAGAERSSALKGPLTCGGTRPLPSANTAESLENETLLRALDSDF